LLDDAGKGYSVAMRPIARQLWRLRAPALAGLGIVGQPAFLIGGICGGWCPCYRLRA
jgi:hypothetical protein